jgi:hypothetical protein
LPRERRKIEFDVIEDDQWYVVDPEGQGVELYPEGRRRFYMPSLLTKRIPTIFIAREKFLQLFSPFLLERKLTREVMGKRYSLRLWDSLSLDDESDSIMRYKFLIKFVHKVERKNFLEFKKLKRRLSKRGDSIHISHYDERYYTKALKLYLFSQKRHFDVFDKKTGLLNSTKKKFWKIITKQYD